MGKRTHGEGSWGTKYIKGYKYYYYRETIDGKRKYIYGKTQKEVKQKLSERQKNHFAISQNTRFGKYISNWVTIKENTIEQSTYTDYKDLIDSLIINYKDYNLNSIKLCDLEPRIFQEYLNSLANTYSKATITKIWQLIKQCIKYGEVQNELKPNLTAFVKTPLESNVANKKKDVPFISEDELNALYELLEGYTDKNNVTRFKNSNNAHTIILIAYTGMRVGEATALKWNNVNLKEGYITIAQATGRIKDNEGKYKYIDKVPKTKSSIRKIPLPDRAIEMLEYFKKIPHEKNDLVCVTNNNTRISSRNINHTLERMCKEAKIKPISIHSLRHTYGSLLLNKGVDIKVISELLGHSNITTTYNIYIGIDETSKKEAVNKLNN